MSALPSTIRPPIRFHDGVILTAPDTCAILQTALRNQLHGELREAFMNGWAVHYSDGTPPQLVRDAIMGAAVGRKLPDEFLGAAMLATFEASDDVGEKSMRFFLAAINWCVLDLVERSIDGQRISFGPKS